MIRPKQLARLGIFHLHEGVLDILMVNYSEAGLTPAGIGRALGLFRGNNPNDGYVWNALRELEEQGKVYHNSRSEGGRGEWHLTDEEYERRRDDI